MSEFKYSSKITIKNFFDIFNNLFTKFCLEIQDFLIIHFENTRFFKIIYCYKLRFYTVKIRFLIFIYTPTFRLGRITHNAIQLSMLLCTTYRYTYIALPLYKVLRWPTTEHS